MLADLPSGSVTRLDVPPLSEDAVAQLVRGTGHDGSAIYRLTGGNAFYVTELTRSPESAVLPASVTDAVLARCDRLAGTAREALDAVSIFPRRAEIAFVDAVLQREASGDIADCIAAGILTDEGDTCAFRHEVARRAIWGALTPPRRRALNARALAVLSGHGTDAARLAHHAREAADPDAVRTYAPLAGEEAARLGAHRQAVEHFRAALKYSNTFDLSERLALFEKFAFESHLVGRTKDALSAQTSALEIHRAAGDRRRQGDSYRWLSRLSYLDGNRIDADRFARQAVDMLEALPPGPELAMAYSNLSQLAMLASRPDETLHYGQKTVALAGPAALNRPDILCHALNNIGTALQWSDVGAARRHLEQSLEIARANDFPEHAARSYTNRGWLEFHRLSDDDARAWLENGIAYCLERDLDTWRDYMRAWLAEVHLRQGRWEDAASAAHLVLANEDAAPLARYPANLVLAKLRTRRGEPADDLMKALAGYLENGMELQRLAPYAALMAERAWLGLCDPRTAIALLDEARSMAASPTMIAEVLVWQRMLGVGVTPAGMPELPLPYRLMLAGDWAAAATSWRDLGAPYEQGLALLTGGHQAQRSALAIFEGLGAAAAAARVRDQLRLEGARLGRQGPRASSRSNAWGLTRRQLDVLRLVDAGQSNLQIAEALCISAKTVDHHISAILEKLDVRSRGQAAAFARSSGLLPK